MQHLVWDTAIHFEISKNAPVPLSEPFTALMKEDGADQDIGSAAWAGEGGRGGEHCEKCVCVLVQFFRK